MLTIIFDLDGTLVDTAPDLIDTLNFTLKQHGLPTLPYEEARRLIGGGMRAMLEGAMVVEGRSASRRRLRARHVRTDTDWHRLEPPALIGTGTA